MAIILRKSPEIFSFLVYSLEIVLLWRDKNSKIVRKLLESYVKRVKLSDGVKNPKAQT